MVARKRSSSTGSPALLLLPRAPDPLWKVLSSPWVCFWSCTAPPMGSLGALCAHGACRGLTIPAVHPRHSRIHSEKWDFLMLLIVLPSSGQCPPLGARISTPGRGEALGCKPSRPDVSLELCRNDLHVWKETETWQGQMPSQAPPPQFCFGLRKGKLSPWPGWEVLARAG